MKTKKILSLMLALAMVFALALPMLADNFTPSAEQKDPAIVQIKDALGNLWAAIGSLGDGGNMQEVYVAVGDLVVTAIKNRDELAEEAAKKLEDAYDAFKNNNNLIPEILGNHYNPRKQYAVSSLFDIHAEGDGVAQVQEVFDNGGKLRVSMDLQVIPGQELYLATQCEDEWVLQDITHDENSGISTVEFSEFCPVVVIQSVGDAEDVPSEEIKPAYGNWWKLVEWLREYWVRFFNRKY